MEIVDLEIRISSQEKMRLKGEKSTEFYKEKKIDTDLIEILKLSHELV